MNLLSKRRALGFALGTMLLTLPVGVATAAQPLPTIATTAACWNYVSPTSNINVINYFNPPPKPWDSGFHRGVDLAADPGAAIVAPGAGVVDFVGLVFGKPTITIQHPDGLISSLEPVVPSVTAGSAVTPGTVVGNLGEWPAEVGANATHCPGSSCLHWGVRRVDLGRDDAYLDPLLLLGAAPPIVLLPTS